MPRWIAGETAHASRAISVRVTAARIADLPGHVEWEPTGKSVKAVIHILVLINEIQPSFSSLLFQLQSERLREALQEIHTLCGASRP
jgi:hypothetical protein